MRDPFAISDAANAERAKREALARHQRERAARRDMRPADELELFNPNRRNARDLFNLEP